VLLGSDCTDTGGYSGLGVMQMLLVWLPNKMYSISTAVHVYDYSSINLRAK